MERKRDEKGDEAFKIYLCRVRKKGTLKGGGGSSLLPNNRQGDVKGKSFFPAGVEKN